MSGNFATKFIWACVFVFINSLAGEIFLFKIVKMDLTNWRRKNSPQSSDQSKCTYISIFAFSSIFDFSANTFQSDQIKGGCLQYEQYPSPDVVSTLCHCSRVMYVTYTGRKTPISFNLRSYVEKHFNGP